MGKCSKCGNKIEYNRFKIYKDKKYCLKCSAAVKLKRKRRKKAKELVEPAEKAKEAMKEQGLDYNPFNETIKEDEVNE